MCSVFFDFFPSKSSFISKNLVSGWISGFTGRTSYRTQVIRKFRMSGQYSTVPGTGTVCCSKLSLSGSQKLLPVPYPVLSELAFVKYKKKYARWFDVRSKISRIEPVVSSTDENKNYSVPVPICFKKGYPELLICSKKWETCPTFFFFFWIDWSWAK